MSPALWMALGATVPVVLLGLFLGGRGLLRRAHDAGRARSRAEVERLRAELDELRAELAASRAAGTDPAAGGGPTDDPAGGPTDGPADGPDNYVITTAGLPGVGPSAADPVPDRLVLSATLGEPLVKIASLAHGVRHALSARTRNRIAFEMRREVKRARKVRRRAARRTRIRATEVGDAA